MTLAGLEAAALSAAGALGFTWARGEDVVRFAGARDLLGADAATEGCSWMRFVAGFAPADGARLIALIEDPSAERVLLLRAADGARLRLRAGWLDPGRTRLAGLLTPAFGARGEAGAPDRPDLARALAGAIAADEVEAWFQPIVALDDGRLLGAEALVRWVLPDGAVMGADDILPLAREADLGPQLGLRMREQAARRAAAWRAAGFAGYVSFNVAASDLARGGLAEELAALRATHGLPQGALRLELTEGEALHDPDGAARALADVRAAGVSVAIDDFGVGHATLAWLDRLPADGLKIDRYFVRTLDDSGAGSQAIFASILGLAAALGLDVVAEGVEGADDARRLTALGCRAAQGFWLGPPRPAAAFTARLAAPNPASAPARAG